MHCEHDGMEPLNGNSEINSFCSRSEAAHFSSNNVTKNANQINEKKKLIKAWHAIQAYHR